MKIKFKNTRVKSSDSSLVVKGLNNLRSDWGLNSLTNDQNLDNLTNDH